MEDNVRFAQDEDAWTNSFSGVVCFPLRPDKTNYRIEDIAHSLSMQCRWNGHTKQFYSVAQHSCYAHDLVMIVDAEDDALMHDSPEAYLTDVPRPIKGHLGRYKELEAETEVAIYKHFDVYRTEDTHAAVKEIDTLLLMRERKLLINIVPGRKWGFEGVDTEYIDKMLPVIPYWSPRRAKSEFLYRYYKPIGSAKIKALAELKMLAVFDKISQMFI